MATAPWGTVWGPVAVPIRASSVKEYTKVARNVDKASLVTGLRTNVRSTRGEYWVLAICNATSVMENTTPVKVNSAVAMVESSVRASSRSVGKSPSCSLTPPMYLAASDQPIQAATTATAGQSNKDSRERK